jgi:Gram-negative bacterial TonB protein C-terminal
MGIRLAIAAVAAFAGLAAVAQTPSAKGKTEAQFAGGFRPDECRWPREARRQQLSGCCQMDLQIDATGRMVAGDGVCSDPMFLEPTLRCLAAQDFIPATRNGAPVADRQHLEYEWRATTPSGNLCSKLKTS